MLMEHFLCDDVGGKRNMCGMALLMPPAQIFRSFSI